MQLLTDKFIKLTNASGQQVIVNIDQIISVVTTSNQDTHVKCTHGIMFYVKESLDDIYNMINSTDTSKYVK